MPRHLRNGSSGSLPEADGEKLLAARERTEAHGAAGGGDEAEEVRRVIVEGDIQAVGLKGKMILIQEPDGPAMGRVQ
jgi:hypothetical protein